MNTKLSREFTALTFLKSHTKTVDLSKNTAEIAFFAFENRFELSDFMRNIKVFNPTELPEENSSLNLEIKKYYSL